MQTVRKALSGRKDLQSKDKTNASFEKKGNNPASRGKVPQVFGQNTKSSSGAPKTANKSAKNVQSSSNQGKSGLKPVDKNPFVNFGNVLNEFLSSKNIGQKKIELIYNDESAGSKFDKLTVTFSRLNSAGTGYSLPVTLTIDDYMEQRHVILGTNGQVPNDKWIAFASKLAYRLQLQVTTIPPSSLMENVMKFIRIHLTPIEQVIMQLNEMEWNKIDSKKVGLAMAAQRKMIDSHYPVSRVNYFNITINKPDPVIIEPYDWLSHGYPSMSKADLMSDFTHKFTPDESAKNFVTVLEEQVEAYSTN
jgi:hypothetical protein